jgi:hypothetical protein
MIGTTYFQKKYEITSINFIRRFVPFNLLFHFLKYILGIEVWLVPGGRMGKVVESEVQQGVTK